MRVDEPVENMEDVAGSQPSPKRAKQTRKKLQADSQPQNISPLRNSKTKYTPTQSHAQTNTKLPQSQKTITPPRKKKLIV